MNETTRINDLRNPLPNEAKMPQIAPGFGSLQSYELMLRTAKLLSSSTLVPAAYRAHDDKKVENKNAIPNCVIALNMACRMGADPLMVMQNLYVVEGRPSWSSQWIIAAINGCGRFSPLRFEIRSLGEKEVEYSVTEWVNRERSTKKLKATVQNIECVAWAIEKESGEKITSPAVNVEMAVKEGWYGKNGSKWQTMPEVMLRYRTASFFGKLYAPELLMGLQTVEEIQDARVMEASHDGSGGYSVDIDSLKPSKQESNDADSEIIDTDTGEIINDKPATQQQIEQDKPDIKAEEIQAGTSFEPSPEEQEAIRAREIAESEADQSFNFD